MNEKEAIAAGLPEKIKALQENDDLMGMLNLILETEGRIETIILANDGWRDAEKLENYERCAIYKKFLDGLDIGTHLQDMMGLDRSRTRD